MSPLTLFGESIIRFLLAAAVTPLITKGIVDAKTAQGFIAWATVIGWGALGALFATVTLVWSHYRNKVMLSLKNRLDAFLGSTPAIPTSTPVLVVQSTVLPSAGDKPTESK